MGKNINLTGVKSGLLTVTRKTGKRNSSGYAIYLCKCECGGVVEISSRALRREDTISSCGCLQKAHLNKVKCKQPTKPLDLVGRKFGRLLVVKLLNERRHGGSVFLCRCDCGNERKILGSSLVKKKQPTRSCGCLKNDINKVNGEKRREDLTGKRFGMLVVTGISKKKTRSADLYWDAVCDCGGTVSARRYSLKNGETRSCGCNQQSWNEKRKTMPQHVYNKPVNKRHIYRSKYLTGSYVKGLLTNRSKLRNCDVNRDLVDVKRLQIAIKRELKNAKH